MKKITFLSFLLPYLLMSQNFEEVAIAAGISHVYDPTGTMGGGATFFDFDNDGWEDLYVTGGNTMDTLYRNNQDGTFTDVTTSAGLTSTQDFYTVGVIAGDIDNDGDQDIFINTWGFFGSELQRNLFFINNGDGTFSEKGLEAGFIKTSFSMTATFIDYNLDGFLDVYIGNYVENPMDTYDNEGNINGFAHDCFPNLMYKNNGDGTFTEVSRLLGLEDVGCALAVMATDFDQDGDMDLYIANDFGEFIVPNAMYRNDHPAETFTNVSSSCGMDVGIYGMGISSADLDKDGDFDYYVTNLGRNVLLENDGNQNFTDIATQAGVENTYALDAPGNLFTTGWGTAFCDVNNDSWPDLLVSNGTVPAAAFIATGDIDPNKLYINNTDNTFTDASQSWGVDTQETCRGMSYSDYDRDGDIDFFAVSLNPFPTSRSVLYRNSLNPSSAMNANHWLQIALEGTTVNRDAVGARVKVSLNNGDILIQEIHGGGSHAGQHSRILHFGIGTHNVDKVEVIWPGGTVEDFGAFSTGQRVSLKEGDSVLSTASIGEHSIRIFPNPSNEGVIYIKGNTIFKSLEVYDILGNTIDRFLLKKDPVEQLDLGGLPSGLYFLSFTGDGLRNTQKVVIN
ncbi:FG-GAP-like repeat-containing protein [Sungkyunkwania multivorans]|uniref:FG-GAP-like repeat-containing protein n=1 Tax=Sungkyunkwania multivorans TaxID=1173618 RepID=A0ABW3CZE8_9FLAO